MYNPILIRLQGLGPENGDRAPPLSDRDPPTAGVRLRPDGFCAQQDRAKDQFRGAAFPRVVEDRIGARVALIGPQRSGWRLTTEEMIGDQAPGGTPGSVACRAGCRAGGGAWDGQGVRTLPEENAGSNGERAGHNGLTRYRVLSPDSSDDREDILVADLRPGPPGDDSRNRAQINPSIVEWGKWTAGFSSVWPATEESILIVSGVVNSDSVRAST